MPTRPMHQALTLQFADRCWITAQTISSQYAGRTVVWIRQCLLQKTFGGFSIARLRKIEIDGLPMAVNCPEQVQPTPGNANESFIHVPGGRFRFQVSAQPPVYFRSVSLNPTPDGGVIHRQTALRHQLLNIPQTQGKPEVPAHARDNNDRLKLPFSEYRGSAGSHLVNLPKSADATLPFIRRYAWPDGRWRGLLRELTRS